MNNRKPKKEIRRSVEAMRPEICGAFAAEFCGDFAAHFAARPLKRKQAKA